MRPVHIAALVLGGCAVASAVRPAHSQPPERLPNLKAGSDGAPGSHTSAKPYGLNDHRFAHRPATSCAASSCHGGGSVGKVGSEHTTWAPEAFPQGSQDPHAKAYRVLFNPVSVEMARKLYGDGQPAHTAPTCLKCHAVESGAAPDVADQVRSEGVGCGGCHGPADKWIGEHYTAAWKQLTPREKWEKYGFVPAGNLVARTLNCAGCHIGDGDRDLNHDLYAAGHPRITFEPARLHNQDDYRKHWTEKMPQPDFEVRLWIVGQAAALRAATNLLYERAKRVEDGDPKTPWPEFAGYSCYACHQKIGDKDIRGIASDAPRPAGSAGWEVWSNTATEIAAGACRDAYPGLPSFSLADRLGEVKKLRELMESKRMPGSKAVKAQAEKALVQLDAWLAAMQAAEDDRASLKPVKTGLAAELAHKLAGNALNKDGKKLKDHDWDALTANYLGAAAMYHATGGAPANGWGPQLTAVRDELRFPKPDDARFDSPALTFGKLDTLRKSFTLLRDATKGGK